MSFMYKILFSLVILLTNQFSFADPVQINQLEIGKQDKAFLMQLEKAFLNSNINWLMSNTRCEQEFKQWGTDSVSCIDLAKKLYLDSFKEGVLSIDAGINGDAGFYIGDEDDLYWVGVYTIAGTLLMSLSRFEGKLWISM
jgi:hypothetical protein